MKGKWFDWLPYLLRYADDALAKITDQSIIAKIMTKGGDISNYDDDLHSLQALYEYMLNNLTDIGGLIFKGAVTTYTDITHFRVAQLAGFGTGAFKPIAGAPYEIYVFQADGAAPEGEQTPIVAYTTLTGIFQHAAFSQILAVGNIIYIIHPLIASLGTVATSAATGAPTTTDELFAYMKQVVVSVRQLIGEAVGDISDPVDMTNEVVDNSVIANILNRAGDTSLYDRRYHSLEAIALQTGLMRKGKVTTATSTTVFTSTDLVELFAGKYIGWWLTCEIDAGGAGAAPQGEWRQISASTAAGAITHAAFTAQLALTDRVKLVPPEVYQALVISGGAVTLKDLEDNQAAMLDYAKNIDTSTLTGPSTEDTIYDKTSTIPFHAVGIWLGFHNMAAGDVIRIRGYMDFDDASIADKFTDDEVWTWRGAQPTKWIYKKLDMLPTYELKFTAEQLDGAAREIYTILDDGARGS